MKELLEWVWNMPSKELFGLLILVVLVIIIGIMLKHWFSQKYEI